MPLTYKKMPVVDIEEVPDWQRKVPKWTELVNDVLALKPGKSLPVIFPDYKSANQARNAVRDRANYILDSRAVRTRLERQEDNEECVLYFLREIEESTE